MTKRDEELKTDDAVSVFLDTYHAHMDPYHPSYELKGTASFGEKGVQGYTLFLKIAYLF